jgi:hypothetical protein
MARAIEPGFPRALLNSHPLLARAPLNSHPSLVRSRRSEQRAAVVPERRTSTNQSQ